MDVQLAEHPAERLLLVEVDVLVAEEDHEMLRQRIVDECLVAYLHDGQDAWDMGPDGVYRPVSLEVGHGAQAALMARYAAPSSN